MARLVVQPGSPAAWEIKLKAGTNSLGRSPANDFKLDDPSVSGSHCQIVVENENAVIKDLGSTNGTYVNRAPVKEAALQPGQTIHLGGLEMMFYADAPAYAGAAQAAAAPRARPRRCRRLPPPRAVAPAGVARGRPTPPPRPRQRQSDQPPPIAAPPVVAAPPPARWLRPVQAPPQDTWPVLLQPLPALLLRRLRHHPRATEVLPPLRHRMRAGAGATSTPGGAQGVLRPLPRRFIYPFRGSGVLVLIVSTVVLSFVEGLTGVWCLISLNDRRLRLHLLLHAEHHPRHGQRGGGNARLAGFDDVFGGAFRLGVTVLICFRAADYLRGAEVL